MERWGVEIARLPQHVSLKQPFAIPSLEDMDIFPSNVLGGVKVVYFETN